MLLLPGDVEPRVLYGHLVALVVPRPIGWISTRSASGVDNLAPYSFFNAVCAKPPVVFFSGSVDRHGRHKHSVTNAVASGEFVVNVVGHAWAEVMNRTSAEAPDGESEFDLAGVTRVASTHVGLPGVGEAAARLECRVVRSLDFGDGGPMSCRLVFGEVVALHVDDDALRPDGQIDPDRLDAVGRMGGTLYTTTRDRFGLERP